MTTLLLRFWPYIALGAIIVSMFVALQVRAHHIEKLEVDKQILQGQLVASQSAVKSLMSSLDEQNRKIDEIKADADKRVATHQAAVKEAQIARNSVNLQAKSLLNKQADPKKTTCENADALINEEIK